jgi:hypothetical protein
MEGNEAKYSAHLRCTQHVHRKLQLLMQVRAVQKAFQNNVANQIVS